MDSYMEVPLGTWVWVDEDDDDDRWFGCVVHVGSNYIRVESPHGERSGYTYSRVHFDDLNDVIEIEEDPNAVIDNQIHKNRTKVNQLVNKVQKLLQDIGLRDRSLPGPQENANALAVASDKADIKQHKNELVKAKDKDLPEIFEQIDKANRAMSKWMSAKVMPMKAQVGPIKEVISEVEDRIFTVELYAGLLEEVEQVRKGSPASLDDKLHILQRRAYMDEECLLDYRAGGMDITSLAKFDKWISKKKNFTRIFPFPRCMVAFRIRRHVKERQWDGTLSGVYYIANMNESDKLTFLYIRNGDQLFRMNTEIKFGSRLFPGRDELVATTKMWGTEASGDGIGDMITDGEHDEILKERAEEKKKAKAWKKKHKRGDHWRNPHESHFEKDHEPFDPSSVYFDDMDKKVKHRIRDYNRIAYVVQGLLDRSKVLHPHSPAKLWTPDGFGSMITLIYDDDKVLYPSAKPPSFLEYLAECNASLKEGSITVGQEQLWMRKEAIKHNKVMNNNWRVKHHYDVQEYSPYGNPGPGYLARIGKWMPRARKAEYRWMSKRAYSWGYRNDYKSETVAKKIVVPVKHLFNVEAYKPGDFKQFFQDPRTRAGYLKWAKVLMAAEDYHGGALKVEMDERSKDHNEW